MVIVICCISGEGVLIYNFHVSTKFAISKLYLGRSLLGVAIVMVELGWYVANICLESK